MGQGAGVVEGPLHLPASTSLLHSTSSFRPADLTTSPEPKGQDRNPQGSLRSELWACRGKGAILFLALKNGCRRELLQMAVSQRGVLVPRSGACYPGTRRAPVRPQSCSAAGAKAQEDVGNILNGFSSVFPSPRSHQLTGGKGELLCVTNVNFWQGESN